MSEVLRELRTAMIWAAFGLVLSSRPDRCGRFFSSAQTSRLSTYSHCGALACRHEAPVERATYP